MDTGAEFEVPHLPDRLPHLAMRQGRHVPHHGVLCSEDRHDAVAGVVGPVFHRHGPLQDRAHALAHQLGRVRLHVPDRKEDLQDIAAGHLRDRHPADVRKGVAPKARHPVMGLPLIAPAGALLLHHPLGGFGEGGHVPRAASFDQGISPLAGQLAVGPRLLAGLGEGHQRHAAESEVAAPAADDEALDPAPGSARLDEEVQAVAVAVSARWGGADESGGKRVVRMAALRLGLPDWSGRSLYVNHYHIICGIELDIKGRQGRKKRGDNRYKPNNYNHLKDIPGSLWIPLDSTGVFSPP